MKGFKNSTKTQSGHGDKIAKVMHEYGASKLHSGSKSGPLVKSPKQAVAIAISEQRKAPIKKADGGRINEESSRPLTAKELAAAKAMKINTPGKSVPVHKSAPKVTDSMILGKGEDKAPGERGAKKLSWEERADRLANRLNREDTGDSNTTGRYLDEKDFADWTSQRNPNARKLTTDQLKSFLSENSAKPKKFAFGGLVPPVASGGMPTLGQPLTTRNMNDARVRPVRQPNVVKPRDGGLPQAWRDNYAADRARRLGSLPAQETRSTGTPPAPARPSSASMDPVTAAKLGYKKGGKVVEKGSKEVYASKAAMKKHEASESKAKERAEHKQEGGELLAGRAQSLRDMTGKPSGRPGYAKGGKSRWS